MSKILNIAMLTALAIFSTASETRAQDVAARMQAWSSALGVECAHCHVDGDAKNPSKPAFEFARRMQAMVSGLNAGPLKDVGEITCATCHRGRAIPNRLPRQSWESILAAHEPEFGGQKNRALAMSVYAASLGVDCSHCHETDRTRNTKPAKLMVAKMLPIFEEIPKYLEESRRPVTQCYMCHQGRIKPER